eukprot:1232404-Rhodomonas_salina.1
MVDPGLEAVVLREQSVGVSVSFSWDASVEVTEDEDVLNLEGGSFETGDATGAAFLEEGAEVAGGEGDAER